MYSYLVTGSNDGPIGIFTSKPKALECAIAYVKQSTDQFTVDSGKYYTSVFTEDTEASLERFHTNYNPIG